MTGLVPSTIPVLGIYRVLGYDEGKTWPVCKLIHAGGSAFSNLVVLPAGRIGVLDNRYGYKTILLATFTSVCLKGKQ